MQPHIPPRPVPPPDGQQPKPDERAAKWAPKFVTIPREVKSPARLLNEPKVCELLGVSSDTLQRLLDDPDEAFPRPIRLRTSKLWSLGSLEAYVVRKQDQAEREERS